MIKTRFLVIFTRGVSYRLVVAHPKYQAWSISPSFCDFEVFPTWEWYLNTQIASQPCLSASVWYKDEPLAPSEAGERSISLLQVLSSCVLYFSKDLASTGRSVAPLHPRRQTATIAFALGHEEVVRIF